MNYYRVCDNFFPMKNLTISRNMPPFFDNTTLKVHPHLLPHFSFFFLCFFFVDAVQFQ